MKNNLSNDVAQHSKKLTFKQFVLYSYDSKVINVALARLFSFGDPFVTGSASGWGRYDDAAVVKVNIFFRKLEYDHAKI